MRKVFKLYATCTCTLFCLTMVFCNYRRQIRCTTRFHEVSFIIIFSAAHFRMNVLENMQFYAIFTLKCGSCSRPIYVETAYKHIFICFCTVCVYALHIFYDYTIILLHTCINARCICNYSCDVGCYLQ